MPSALSSFFLKTAPVSSCSGQAGSSQWLGDTSRFLFGVSLKALMDNTEERSADISQPLNPIHKISFSGHPWMLASNVPNKINCPSAQYLFQRNIYSVKATGQCFPNSHSSKTNSAQHGTRQPRSSLMTHYGISEHPLIMEEKSSTHWQGPLTGNLATELSRGENHTETKDIDFWSLKEVQSNSLVGTM